jgi:hypothetical protein
LLAGSFVSIDGDGKIEEGRTGAREGRRSSPVFFFLNSCFFR